MSEEKLRVVSVGKRLSQQRVLDLVSVALAEITPKPDREQTIAAGNAAMRYADELGIILTRQVSA